MLPRIDSSRISIATSKLSLLLSQRPNRTLTDSPLSKIPDFGPPLSRIDRDSSEPAFTAFIALHELVDALNQEWIDKLTVHHGADVRFFLSSPFEKGIQSLQGFYCGTLPRTFEDIFALMHIVHACASIYHGKDEPHFWDAFFLDILQWHHAIAAEEEQLFFLKIAFQLWHVPGYSLTEATEYSNNLLPPLTWPEIHTKLRNTGSICFNHSQKPTPQAFDPSVEASILSAIDLNKLDLLRLRDAFSEGQVISLCTRYLDGKLLLSIEIILICLQLKMYRFRLCKDLCT